MLRGTLRLRPDAKAAAANFAAQLGAFSSEESAKSALERLSAELSTPGALVFSADRGVYRVLLGRFPDRASAELFVQSARQAGHEALVAEGSAVASTPAAVASVVLSAEDGVVRRLLSPVDISPADPDSRVLLEGKPYRGSLRISVNSRGLLNVVNLVDLEEYLYGVVPSEMGPKRYDEIEALKAQAVAARTYALAHRGQFEAEGYDICATPKCQVYGGLSAEDPLSTAAVEGTRGLVLTHGGQLADALFVSTCGGRTENVENVFGERPEPYLVSVECGELETTVLPGAPLERGKTAGVSRSGLSWRGYVLRRHAVRRAAVRAAALDLAQQWAGVAPGATAPQRLTPAAVYPSIVTAFGLGEASEIHLLPRDERYYGETPSASGHLSAAAAQAYDFLIRFRFGAGEPLPPADATVSEEDYAGLLFSAALRLSGVAEGSGRFLRREGANLWVKTAEGRLGLPVDPELPLARRVGDRYLPSPTLTLRAGDRLRWWKRGSQVLALWVEWEAAGTSFERDSSWTEWVRRASARELARRMSQRVAGTEVRDLTVVRRSPAGRVVELEVSTDAGRIRLNRFDVRQALEVPELLFTFQKVRGPLGESEWVFLGRGWGHGVGLCQNGAYGMALAGAAYEDILRHYYVGIDIVAANTVTAVAPSGR
jgi:stage II sporulation protein D